MNLSAQSPRRQREQAAARADVEEAFAAQGFDFEHLLQRGLGSGNALFVQEVEKAAPVLAKLETLAGAHFFGVRAGCPHRLIRRMCFCAHRFLLYLLIELLTSAAGGASASA